MIYYKSSVNAQMHKTKKRSEYKMPSRTPQWFIPLMRKSEEKGVAINSRRGTEVHRVERANRVVRFFHYETLIFALDLDSMELIETEKYGGYSNTDARILWNLLDYFNLHKKYVVEGKANLRRKHKYELINYFDVWGNEKDGWEVNNLCSEGYVIILEGADDREICEVLRNADFLKPGVGLNRLTVDNCNFGDMIEIFEKKTQKPICRLQSVSDDTELNPVGYNKESEHMILRKYANTL
jgi:hypothetical protein